MDVFSLLGLLAKATLIFLSIISLSLIRLISKIETHAFWRIFKLTNDDKVYYFSLRVMSLTYLLKEKLSGISSIWSACFLILCNF